LRTLSPDRVFTNKDILPRYKALKLPLLYQPGTDGNYDNSNFIFLALIVEKVSGMFLTDYLTKQILEPAEMANTIFPTFAFYHYTPQEKINLSLTYKLPRPYSDNYERTDTMRFVSKYWHSYNFKGAGEIVSTAEDLFKYDQALYNGKLLSNATMKEAFTPVRLTNGNINPVGNGLGWRINRDSEFGELVSHTGGLVGIRTIFLRNITKHQTIILLDNTENDVDEIAENVLKLLNGRIVKLPGKSIAKVYGKSLATDGIDKARVILEQLQNDSLNYSLSENEFNNLGYDFMENNKESEALEVFQTNVKFFPRSWNVYDSYGEALLKYGKTEEGIKMYKRAIELNPENLAAKKILDRLLKN
jgi:CubicO group peptidase (beta-lactamase class C family)